MLYHITNNFITFFLQPFCNQLIFLCILKFNLRKDRLFGPTKEPQRGFRRPAAADPEGELPTQLPPTCLQGMHSTTTALIEITLRIAKSPYQQSPNQRTTVSDLILSMAFEILEWLL